MRFSPPVVESGVRNNGFPTHRSASNTHIGRFPPSQVSSGVSSPPSWSMAYDAMRPESRPAEYTKRPAGSRLNARGTGSVATRPVAVSRPDAGSTAKLATLLCPRFGA